MLWVWEHTLGDLPSAHVRRENLYVKTHRWHRAVQLWSINPVAVARLWDLWVRSDFRCDVVVTTRPAEFAIELAERFEYEDIPVRHTRAMGIGDVARRAINLPDVAGVIFGDPKQEFAFGRKGRFMAPNGEVLL
jgi:hypothetical protein